MLRDPLSQRSHLLPEGVDKEPTNEGEGETEEDLDDHEIAVQLVDIEEEYNDNADQVDGKVEGHPEESWEDELVSWLADAKDEQAACDDRDEGEEDVDDFQTKLDVVDLVWLLQRPTDPWVSVVGVLKTDLLQTCSCNTVQGFWLYNETAKKKNNVQQVENDRNNCNGQAACPQLERRTMLLCGQKIPQTEFEF